MRPWPLYPRPHQLRRIRSRRVTPSQSTKDLASTDSVPSTLSRRWKAVLEIR